MPSSPPICDDERAPVNYYIQELVNEYGVPKADRAGRRSHVPLVREPSPCGHDCYPAARPGERQSVKPDMDMRVNEQITVIVRRHSAAVVESTVTVTGRKNMKYSLQAIPIEVLALAFIEFVFVNSLAAVLWYMFGHK